MGWVKLFYSPRFYLIELSLICNCDEKVTKRDFGY